MSPSSPAAERIGAAVGLALAEDGWTVVLAGRRKAALEDVVAHGGDLAGALEAVPTDVTDEAGVRRLFDAAVSARPSGPAVQQRRQPELPRESTSTPSSDVERASSR